MLRAFFIFPEPDFIQRGDTKVDRMVVLVLRGVLDDLVRQNDSLLWLNIFGSNCEITDFLLDTRYVMIIY